MFSALANDQADVAFAQRFELHGSCVADVELENPRSWLKLDGAVRTWASFGCHQRELISLYLPSQHEGRAVVS